MSGLEVLGAAAAATQLLGYMINITEALLQLRDHIKHAPARFQSYVEQLESLAIIIRSIKDGQERLTILIESPLRAISQKVDTLNQLLNKSIRKVSRPATTRYIRIFAEKKNERRIKENFAALEGLKVNLGLCIAQSNRKSLENLRVDLRACMSNTEVMEEPEKEGSISLQTESTLNEDNQLILCRNEAAQPRKASVDSNVTMSDKPETAKKSQSAETETNCLVVGVESTGNAIGGVGWGLSHGEIRDSKATKNFFGGIGPMGPDFLKVLMQANLPLLPPDTQNATA